MRKCLISSLLFFSFFLASSPLSAQKNGAYGQIIFLAKKIDLGDTVAVKLRITRETDAEVSIPDTFKAFKPYELLSISPVKRTYIDSKTIEETVFRIRSFRVDSMQTIQLPLDIQYKGKTYHDTTNTDKIPFTNRIRALSEELQYMTQSRLAPVEPPVDPTWMYAIAGGVVLILGIGLYFLRKPIRRWWMRRKVQNEWNRTQRALETERLRITEDSPTAVPEINILWKRYLQPSIPVPVSLMSRTAWEIDETLSSHSALPPEDLTVLSEWCRAEELILYAHQNYGKEQLIHLFNQLIRLLEREVGRRKEAVR